MSPSTAVCVAVALPLIGAFLVVSLQRWPNAREAASLITGGALFGVVLSLLPQVQSGARPEAQLVEVMSGLWLAFRLEPLGMLFALVASGLWIVTTMYAIGYMRGHHEKNQTRFYACFAIAISAAMGVAMAANLLTLFVFYEVLTLSTYPLVTHHRTENAMRAGRVYLGILIGTSVGFLLLATIWTWHLAGTLDFRPGGILDGRADNWVLGILLALFAFGTGKAALMPFHRWLPAAMVAPTPVSALLHAVAVVKAGVFTIVKVAVYIFGLDYLRELALADIALYLAGFTIIVASIVALRQDNLKRRLAYSTVSQLSYVILAALILSPLSTIGAALHIAVHAFGKITLFICLLYTSDAADE